MHVQTKNRNSEKLGWKVIEYHSKNETSWEGKALIWTLKQLSEILYPNGVPKELNKKTEEKSLTPIVLAATIVLTVVVLLALWKKRVRRR